MASVSTSVSIFIDGVPQAVHEFQSRLATLIASQPVSQGNVISFQRGVARKDARQSKDSFQAMAGPVSEYFFSGVPSVEGLQQFCAGMQTIKGRVSREDHNTHFMIGRLVEASVLHLQVKNPEKAACCDINAVANELADTFNQHTRSPDETNSEKAQQLNPGYAFAKERVLEMQRDAIAQAQLQLSHSSVPTPTPSH